MTPADVSHLLSRAAIRATDELEIQGAIERVLVAAGLDVAREVRVRRAADVVEAVWRVLDRVAP